MIFIDTSAIYALADRADANHTAARQRFETHLQSGLSFLTHNYVLVEAFALLHSRLGLPTAIKFAQSAGAFEVEWISQAIHDQAVTELGVVKRTRVSLVDQISFLVMRARGVRAAFAFDDDFAREGFEA